MRRLADLVSKIGPAAALALALVVLVAPSAASAGEAEVSNFRGEGMGAFFQSLDNSGCVQTTVDVEGISGTFEVPPQPPEERSLAALTIRRADLCNDTLLMDASGVAATPLQIGDDLVSASLNSTINVYDEVSNSSFDVSVNVAWTATGDVSHGGDHEHFVSREITIIFFARDTFRDATAVGTVTDGITDFTPEPSLTGEIFSRIQASVVIG